MPAEFDKMRKAIKAQLKKDNPKLSDDDLESKSYAIATANWKNGHNGKAPESSETNLTENWHMLEFNAPISENSFVNDDFIIKGTAISETVTHNNHKYIAEELEKAAPSMKGRPLLVDHDSRIESIKGKVSNSYFDEKSRSIKFEAKVMDKNIREMIKDGRISNVSIGAYAEDLIKEESGNALIAKGIKIAELSLVATPADENASFVMAMSNSYSLKESMKKDKFKCKDCGKTFDTQAELDDHEESEATESHNIPKQEIKTERRYGEMTDEKANELVEQNKKLLEEINSYKAEKRQNLISEYKKLCAEKKVSEKDVSKVSEESILLLIEQLKDIVIREEKKEMKSVVAEHENVADNFMIEKSSSGYAFWMMPDKKLRSPRINGS